MNGAVDTVLIVPTYDGLDLFPAFLESLDRSMVLPPPLLVLRHRNDLLEPAAAEIYDRCLDRLLEHRPQCVLQRIHGPFNYSRMMNEALAGVDGGVEFVCLANDDIVFASGDWLGRMRAVMESDSQVDIVGAKLLYPGVEPESLEALFKQPQNYYGTLQHAGVCIVQQRGSAHRYSGRPWNYPPTMVDRRMEAVTFALVLLRRRLLERIQFDETLDCDFNDIDFCLQAERLGRGIVFTSDSVHFHRETVTRRKYALHGKAENKNHFMEKWRSRIARAPDLRRFEEMDAGRG